MEGKDALILLANKRKQGKKDKHKSRKVGRNYRWDEGPDGKAITHSTTKYRARHGIGPGPRKKAK